MSLAGGSSIKKFKPQEKKLIGGCVQMRKKDDAMWGIGLWTLLLEKTIAQAENSS